jgi:hypothetical protein
VDLVKHRDTSTLVLILSFRLVMSTKSSLPFRFYNWKLVRFYHGPCYVCYMSHSSHPPWFDHLNKSNEEHKLWHFLLYFFLHTPPTCYLLGPHMSPGDCSHRPPICVPPLRLETIHPHKTAGTVIVLCISILLTFKLTWLCIRLINM